MAKGTELGACLDGEYAAGVTHSDQDDIAGSEPPYVCSFCGGSEFAPGDLVEGGGPNAGGLPFVHICRDCVEACAEAFSVEQRVSADEWPDADATDAPAPVVVDWSEDSELEVTSQVRLPKPKD